METINRIFYVMTVLLSLALYGVSFISVLRENITLAVLSLVFAVLMHLIVKYWDNK